MSTFMGAPSARQMLDPGYLASGLFSIDKLERYLSERLPINDFRELPRPVYITAVDLDQAKRVVFGPGYEDRIPISQAVAASCCVPGLFRPYRIGDRYFVDGEIARTLSADVAVQAGADIVIVSISGLSGSLICTRCSNLMRLTVSPFACGGICC